MDASLRQFVVHNLISFNSERNECEVLQHCTMFSVLHECTWAPESMNKCTQNLKLVEISNHGEIQTKENDPVG